MKIIVLSCDKNEDTFKPFHWCMEEYFPCHPEIIYFTESINNPYYRTISIPHELNDWSRGVREFLKWIDDEHILLMIDDIFIRKPVDIARLQEADKCLKGNIACFNFEKSWDRYDQDTELEGWKKREHGREYEVSLMCGLWDKEKLLKVLDRDCDPWKIELEQDSKGFDYYINSGDYIIDWGYRTLQPVGIAKGKWTRECIEFLKGKGFDMDWNKRGIV